MDQLIPVLLHFPPAGGIAGDDHYDSAARSHNQQVDKLAESPEFGDAAAQLIDVGLGLEMPGCCSATRFGEGRPVG